MKKEALRGGTAEMIKKAVTVKRAVVLFHLLAQFPLRSLFMFLLYAQEITFLVKVILLCSEYYLHICPVSSFPIVYHISHPLSSAFGSQ